MAYKRTVSILYFFLCFIGATASLAQSQAHEKSAYAIIDPVYSSQQNNPESNITSKGASWIYGAGELESWRLRLLMARKDSAELRVGYPGTYHSPYDTVSYRLFIEDPIDLLSLTFRTVGQGSLYLNGVQADTFGVADKPITAEIGSVDSIHEIQFDLVSEKYPPALLIEDRRLSTSSKNWQWKGGDGQWEPAYHFPQTVSGVPPHLLENPKVELQPESSEEGLYDFGRELMAFVIIQSQDKPVINIGESKTEALDVKNKVLEQSTAVESIGDGLWRTKHAQAFRYIYLENSQEIRAKSVYSEALFYPTYYKGAFACSDSTLTQIWMNSAYTLRVNMHDFLLDGIKRDRLPWAGDLTMSTYANAYSFNEPELVRRSLVALNKNGIEESDVNGIVDYSLAWIIAQDKYQLYFGDRKHLKRAWNNIKETVYLLLSRTDEKGFLEPEDLWVFIDWVDQEKWTALQVYWWWAQQSAINLAERVGDTETAELLREKARILKTNLTEVAWNEKQQAWQAGMVADSGMTRHPNFMAVVSGLASLNQYDGIKNILEDDSVPSVGTPYMAGFENMAVSRLGNIEYMLNQVTEYWGGMLEEGATTFWEAYDATQDGEEQYAFYDRPYGKSLAHAWSAGPAAFLPSEIFGLRPLEDGWKRFSLDIDLGYLEWASVSVPTKYGDITVDADKESISIKVPSETVMEWNGRTVKGPADINQSY